MTATRATEAVIGSGTIGTDLKIKVPRLSEGLEVAATAGIDPESEGLARRPIVTCGGQATIPVVVAVGAVAPVHHGETVASIGLPLRRPAPGRTSATRSRLPSHRLPGGRGAISRSPRAAGRSTRGPEVAELSSPRSRCPLLPI